MESYIKRKVSTGFYGNATEVIRDAIRRMQADEERAAVFHRAVAEGEAELDRGEGTDYTATQHRRNALTGHGSRVLALTPAHLRKPAAPTGITANMLLPVAESTPVIATENSVAHYRHYFRREDLYRLVWTSPVSEIAVYLGVSDVALANLCRRAAI